MKDVTSMIFHKRPLIYLQIKAVFVAMGTRLTKVVTMNVVVKQCFPRHSCVPAMQFRSTTSPNNACMHVIADACAMRQIPHIRPRTSAMNISVTWVRARDHVTPIAALVKIETTSMAGHESLRNKQSR